MPQNGASSNLGRLAADAGRLISKYPLILIPAVIPAIWLFIAPLTGLLNPAAIIALGYVGVGSWRIFGFTLIYVFLLAVSQGLTIALVRDAAGGGSVSLSQALEEAISRGSVLLASAVVAAVIISVSSLVFIFPSLVAAFFLWYFIHSVILEEEAMTEALRSGVRFATARAGETLLIVLAALIVGLAFIYIPFVGWLLTIPTVAYFVTLSTLFFIEQDA